MPLMMVWPLSGSVDNPERGVFLRKPVERHAHLFLIGLRLGLNRDLDNRIGNSMRSRMTGLVGSHSVSPVVTSLRPAMATISPA